MSKIANDGFGLKYFIRKQQTLNLYREMLKSTRNVTDQTVKIDVKNQIVEGFRRNSNVTNAGDIRSLLVEGNRYLKQIKDLNLNVSVQNISKEGSWLDTDDTDDPRGRVGNGWPWSK